MKAIRFIWWSFFPPMSVKVARRLHRQFAGLSIGREFLRVHWRTLSPDVREFLALEGIDP